MRVLGDQLVQRVGGHRSLNGQHLRCRRGRRYTESQTALGADIEHCGGEHGGLPGTSGADDQLQLAMTGDGGHGCNLPWSEVPDGADGPGSCPGRFFVLAPLSPDDQLLLLIKDRWGGERPIHRRFGDRPAVTAQLGTGRDGARDVDAADVGDIVGEQV